MRNQHTPAPWFAVQYVNQWNIQSEDGYEGVNTNVIDEEQDDNHEANAKLIEAAPDMYEALSNYVKVIERFFETLPEEMVIDLITAVVVRDANDKAKAAIAKAEGKEASHE